MTSHFFRLSALVAALCVVATGAPASAIAAEKTAADLLPASIVGYLEIRQPGKTLDVILDHPLALELQKQPPYQQALQSPQYEHVRAAVKRVEDQLGLPWRQAASGLTSGGLYVGFDLPSQGVVVLAQAADEKVAEKALAIALDLVRSMAAGGGQPDPVKQDEHRDVKIYAVGDAHFAVCGKWIIATNKRLLAWMSIENYLTPGSSLSGDDQFQAVLKDKNGQSAAWLYVDLRVLRLTGGLRKALNKKSDNPPLEVVAGGILGALPDAPYVTAALELDVSRLKLTTTLPSKTRDVAKTREFYFGADAQGNAPPLLRPAGTLLSLSTYRDFASLWRHAPDLFDEGVNAKMVEAEGKLTTFFAGRNLRDDILGNLEPGVQVVAARQEFPQAGITPAIKLPAAAAVVRMKHPEETSRLFKITFQSFVGFLNIAAAQKGVGPLEMNTEKIGDALMISSQYLPPTKANSQAEAPLQYNASPTIAFVGDKFIVASARPLALALVKHVQENLPLDSGINTQIAVDGKTAQAALAENRGPLVAQNMLEKGHDRAAAEREIDGLLLLLQKLEGLSLKLAADDSRLQLALELKLADAK
jgi:hypothetical protein